MDECKHPITTSAEERTCIECGLVLGPIWDDGHLFRKRDQPPISKKRISLQCVYKRTVYLHKVLDNLTGNIPITSEDDIFTIMRYVYDENSSFDGVRLGYSHFVWALREAGLTAYRSSIFWLIKHYGNEDLVLHLSPQDREHIIQRFEEVENAFNTTFSHSKMIERVVYRRTTTPRLLKRRQYTNSTTGRVNMPSYRFIIDKILKEMGIDYPCIPQCTTKKVNVAAESVWSILKHVSKPCGEEYIDWESVKQMASKIERKQIVR